MVARYVRFYTNKLNSGGLPAVYLYLAGKSKAVVVDLKFTLHLAGDVTEILTYSFGDAAKFEGFGKTLREPLAVDRSVCSYWFTGALVLA